MKDRIEMLDSLLRGIFYVFFVIFALVASLVPGALVWAALVGTILVIGLIGMMGESLHWADQLSCSMCVFYKCSNGEAECKLKEIVVRDGPVCEDFIQREHLKAA